MAGNSSSSAVDLRDRNTNESTSYDLQNWQGLTAVLKMGKDALPDADEYGAFRNLVLQYAQQGGDVELKKKIIETISRFGKPQETLVAVGVPPTAPDSVPPQKNTPDFLPHVFTDATQNEESVLVPKVETVVSSPKNSCRLLPRFGAVLNEETSPEVQAAHAVENGAPVLKNAEPIPVPEEIVAPSTEDISIPISKIETLPVEEMAVPEPEVEVETPLVSHSIEEHKARITEIKHQVHTHFGNPAALVDMRSNVGKNYMKALLTALKATGPGSDADADAAMRELESANTKLMEESKAHALVLKVVEAPAQKVVTAPAPKPEPEDFVAPLVVPVPESKPESKDVPMPTPEVQFITPEIPTEPEPVEEFTKDDEAIPEEVIVEKKVESKYSAKNTLAQLSSHRNEYVPQAPQSKLYSVLPDTSDTTQARSAISQNKHTLRGLGKDVAYGTGRQPAALPQDVVVKQSELVSEEITLALRTLLHDWSLFAGSGLFGTGPSGIEHPLYQQLAALSMGEVIAGRWEHSDPKVTKIIKEYVDAWRHEQGVAFTTNETFEHYLRRVIQRILKRQTV